MYKIKLYILVEVKRGPVKSTKNELDRRHNVQQII
jgi:hypothetical protein